MDSILNTLIGGIIGITGSLLVFAMTVVRERHRAATALEQRYYNVRVLLYTETEHNKSLLKRLHTLLTTGLYGSTWDDLRFQPVAHFLTEPLPVWGTLMWTSNAGSLADVLTDMTIRRLYEFYADLEMLSVLRNELARTAPPHLIEDYVAFWADKRAAESAGQSYGAIDTWVRYGELGKFKRNTAETWTRCEGIINRWMQEKPLEAPMLPWPKPSVRERAWARLAGKKLLMPV